MTNEVYTQTIRSEMGWVEITASEQGIQSIYFKDDKQREDKPNQHTKAAVMQLEEYFAGSRDVFDLPLDMKGTTFQRSVWDELLKIPYGETCSYKQIADKLNNPKAVRAVGAANGKNPVSIVVPCHRVIGSNQTLTGYAGGLERKAKLLSLENAQQTFLI
ncbi:methylated-DNA--[protein]-cysteine S-methyltransferase [Aestuariibacter sp. AA17]|uniref:Methylated-DNA--protein-cysteine methyltransferase n=1 Tax=Fluctibacter corallii TaxID=2984329 RepID=A0ABT3AAQ7_9ALTE|nr:methylated-DNA--[protein]-cysteine S-methyltransferase [Aestuariibacter sp. AA17]MCV2885699.1 methylated-DNA--[protein]-cysteine S-methyltransferase [Aestuariibacter sp. AA17]